IQHVIVLMLENRSFDHMVGCFQSIYPQLKGIPPGAQPRTNSDPSGQIYPQNPGAARTLQSDPKHEYIDVLQQLTNNNSGFVDDFARNHPHSSLSERAEIMRYHAL